MKNIIQMHKAVEAISTYNYSTPLAIHLKQFCRLHKEMGSRDRKFLQQLVFQYFRLNNTINSKSIEEKIAVSHVIFNEKPDDFYNYWFEKFALPNELKTSEISFRIKIATSLNIVNNVQSQFPVSESISSEINIEKFLNSILSQPYTWIRCKRKQFDTVKAEFQDLGIEYFTTEKTENALGFKRHINFSQMKTYQKGFFEVQDLSSQLTGTLFQPKQQQNWWDCCAASGGKSLLLKDIEPTLKLWATDSRATIIENLKLRLRKANTNHFETSIIDLEHQQPNFNEKFDGIVLDAPCTGSGTWGRNPERMTSFQNNEIETYTEKQFKIANRVAPFLKADGRFIYNTCSVYKQENEENVKRIAESNNLKIEQIKYFKGYEYNADSMFAAVLHK
jgi:16S rRNA (cytosine967-C5)-methyltransferase